MNIKVNDYIILVEWYFVIGMKGEDMKQSILALVMALILCIGAVPAEVMAASDPGDASRSADKISGMYKADDSKKAAEYAGDTAKKQTPSDGASFNPYKFDVDGNGEHPSVELEPKLMGATSGMEQGLPLSGNGTILPGNGTMPGNNTGDKGKTFSPEEFKIEDLRFNDTFATLNLSWDYQPNITDYRLIVSIKKNNNNDTKYLVNSMYIINERQSPDNDSVLLYSVYNNQSSNLNGVKIPIVPSGEEQFDTSEGINKAKGIVYGDKVMLWLVPVVEGQVQGDPGSISSNVSFDFFGNEFPPIIDRAIYNFNDTLRMKFETQDLNSTYYEVLGLSEQNPGGSRESININGTDFYVFARSNVNRSDALISNVTKEYIGLVNDVTFNATLKNVQLNSTSMQPAIGETVYFAVRSENSEFPYPIPDFVGCDVPVLQSAVIFNQTATIDFTTYDVNMSHFDVHGFVKNEESGSIHIGNGTYSEFGQLRCDSKNAEYLINTTDTKGNPLSEVRISAPVLQFNETAEPVKPGDTLYFTVETEHGRDPDKTFNEDYETDGFSNLVETVVEKLTPVINAEDITKTAKAKDQSFALGASTDGGQLNFNSSSPSVTVNPDGIVTVKKNFIGKAVITVNTTETKEYKSVSKDVNITVKPAKVAWKKIKNVKKRKVKATWTKSPLATITGYQIRYSTSKAFPKSKTKTKTKTIGSRKKTLAFISKLKKGKKYYFKIRTYKKTSAGYYYSDWTTYKKAVKIKK